MIRSSTYLIEAENGLVKIGLGLNVRDRVQAVRCHSPVLARLIAFWPGSALEDDALKERFRAYRRHGEWFVCEGEFAAFVERHRGLGVERIPDWSELLFANQTVYRLKQSSDRVLPRKYKIGRAASELKSGMTPKQLRCLNYIRAYIKENTFSPSYDEIAVELGLMSKSGVYRLVHALVERGYLSLLQGAHRSIRLAEPESGSRAVQQNVLQTGAAA